MAVSFGWTEFKPAMGGSGKKTILQAHGGNKDEPQKKRLDFEILIKIRVASAYRWQLKLGTRWYHQGQRRGESWGWNFRAAVLLWHTASTSKQPLLYLYFNYLFVLLYWTEFLKAGSMPTLAYSSCTAGTGPGVCQLSVDVCRAAGSPRFKRGRGKATAGGRGVTQVSVKMRSQKGTAFWGGGYLKSSGERTKKSLDFRRAWWWRN